DACGQGHRAMERAVTTLPPDVLLVLLLATLLVLTGDRQDAVLDFDLYLLGLDSGDVGAKHQVPVVAHDVDRGRPCAIARIREVAEQAVKPHPQLTQLAEGIPPLEGSSHDHLLTCGFDVNTPYAPATAGPSHAITRAAA